MSYAGEYLSSRSQWPRRLCKYDTSFGLSGLSNVKETPIILHGNIRNILISYAPGDRMVPEPIAKLLFPSEGDLISAGMT